MVVKNLRTIAHAFRKTDFYCCTYVCKCTSSFCRLEERGMGIIPVADTINGTTYSALCFHVFYFHCKILVLLILLLLLLWMVWFSMVDLTVLLVVHCHTECQTIGLSITGRAGDERNQALIWDTTLHHFYRTLGNNKTSIKRTSLWFVTCWTSVTSLTPLIYF